MTPSNDDDPKLIRLPLRVYGDDAYPAWHRKLLPLETPRVRYPGFRPGTELLRAGTIRMEGALPIPCDIVLERDVAVALRDGTIVYADVFRPVGKGSHPVVLHWSPYGKQLGGPHLNDVENRAGVPADSVSELMTFEGLDPAVWVAAGYVIINADQRGAYKSGGNLVYPGRQMAEDGFDFVQWAGSQPWSNGKVGMAGNSWLATVQWFIAAERPSHLAAIAPWEGLTDGMRAMCLRGGIPMLHFAEEIAAIFAGENMLEDRMRMSILEPDDTPYWRDKIVRLELIEVPAYVVASYDNPIHTQGTLEGFQKIASKDKWLRILNTNEWQDLYDPRSTADLMDFFDRYLKGVDNGWEATPRVRIAVIDPSGIDEVERVVDAWPPMDYEHRRLYLSNQGQLTAQPAEEAQAIRYAATQRTPTKFRMRIDADSEIIGYLKLRLWVEVEGATDMDLVVIVEKTDAEGRSFVRKESPYPFIARGYLRASRRKLDPTRGSEVDPVLLLQGEELLSAGQIVPLDISIWPTGLKLHAGEYLQLSVAPFSSVGWPDLHYGEAPLTVAAGRFTYEPGEVVEKMTLGGSAMLSPQWSRDLAVIDKPRNAGTHILHLGGRFDSHLLVPLKTVALTHCQRDPS